MVSKGLSVVKLNRDCWTCGWLRGQQSNIARDALGISMIAVAGMRLSPPLAAVSRIIMRALGGEV